MFDLRLFRNSTFVGANITALLLMVAMFGVFFFLSLYMQTVLGYTAIQAGAAFLPMTCLVIVVAPIAGRLSDKIGPRWLMTGGMTLTAITLFIFSQLDANSNFWNLLPGTILGGIGMAGTMSPMTAAALSAVPVDKAGVGSGILNTFRQVGVSIGIALMGAIFASEAATATAEGLGPTDVFLAGLHPAFRIAAFIALGGAVVAALTVRNRPRTGSHEPSAESVGLA